MQTKTINIQGIGQVLLRKHPTAKRIKLIVKSSSNVTVTLPKYGTYKAGEAFLKTNLDWVKRQQSKLQKQAPATPAIQHGSEFKTSKKTIRIKTTKNKNAHIIKDKEFIDICIPEELDLSDPKIQKAVQGLVVEHLRIEAKLSLPDRLHKWAKLHKITINRVFIKNNTSRWGSCSAQNNINLSLFLMLLPERLIDYVLCHELAHVKEKNHSKAFWAHLEMLLPGSKKLDKELNAYRIPFKTKGH